MSNPAVERDAGTTLHSAGEGRALAAGAGLVTVGTMVAGVLNLCLVAVLTRVVDRQTFAILTLIYLIQETVSVVAPLGLPGALSFFIPKRGDGAARALGFWTGTALAAIAAPLALGLALIGPALASTSELRVALGYLALYVLGDIPGQALPATLLARRAYRAHFGVQVAFAASRFLSLALPALVGAPLEAMLTCFVAVATARLAAFLVYFGAIAKGSLSRSLFRLREHLVFGLPLSLSVIVGKINVQVDKYLIAAVGTASVFAVYTVGATELPLVQTLAYSVTNALVPALVVAYDRREVPLFVEYWHGAVVKVAAVMLPVFFYFVVLAEPTIRLLFSAGYAEAVVPFRIYLLLLPLRLCGYGAIVRALGETRPVLVSAVAALVANAVLMLPLYDTLGLAGPALAAVIGQLVAVALLLARIRVRLRVAWTWILPFRMIGRTLAAGAVSAIPLVPIALVAWDDAVRLLIGVPVFVVCYTAVGLWGKVLSPADFLYLRDLVTLRALRRPAASER